MAIAVTPAASPVTHEDFVFAATTELSVKVTKYERGVSAWELVHCGMQVFVEAFHVLQIPRTVGREDRDTADALRHWEVQLEDTDTIRLGPVLV